MYKITLVFGRILGEIDLWWISLDEMRFWVYEPMKYKQGNVPKIVSFFMLKAVNMLQEPFLTL